MGRPKNAEKKCPRCGRTEPEVEFYMRKNTHVAKCKDCHSAHMRDRYYAARRQPSAGTELDTLTRTWGRQ